MVKNANWTPISVSIDLVESIESFVNSREGKKLGYKSKSGFVADAIREKLERDNSVKPQLDRIERDLAFLTDKLLYEKTRKELVKRGLYESKDNKSELLSWEGPRVKWAKYLKEQGFKPHDFEKKISKGVKNKELEKKVTNS